MLTTARKAWPPGNGGLLDVVALGLALAGAYPHPGALAQSPPVSPDSTYSSAPPAAAPPTAAPPVALPPVPPLPPERAAPLSGASPGGRLECGWVGTRIINLLVRDDIDGANQYHQLYSVFGCSGEQLAQAFRCTVSGGSEAGAPINDRIAGCWTNPGMSQPLAAPPAKTDTDAPPAADTRR